MYKIPPLANIIRAARFLVRRSFGGMPGIRLEGEKLYLRPPRADDWEAWAAVRGASQMFLRPWEPTWPQDALTYRAFMRRLRRQSWEWRHDEGYTLLGIRHEDDQIVCGIALTNVRRGVAQTATVGYWVGEPFARQGYTLEALLLMAQFSFGSLGLHRIEAACLPSNDASRGLLAKAGFTEEGFARNYLRIDGSWRDHILFAMLREDWLMRPFLRE
jgi:ribosomal-protein-alanine N-acetyltransferase